MSRFCERFVWYNIQVRIVNPRRIILLSASHTERVVFGKQPVSSCLASISVNVQIPKSTKFNLCRKVRVRNLFYIGEVS